MRTITVAALLSVVLPALAAAQQPAPTLFHEHRIGETASESLTLSHADLSKCQKPKRDVKEACRTIEAMLSGKRIGVTEKAGDSTVIFLYDHAVLTEITVSTPLIRTTYQEQIDFLTGKYGKPTTTATKTVGNALGGRWECGEAVWMMPDGALIVAKETVDMVHDVSATRELMVTFSSKEHQARVSEDRKTQNPY